MGTFLSRRELAATELAENAAFRSPVPTRMVSNGEFNPLPQTPQQRQFEARLKELAGAAAKRLGTSRRNFLRTSCGMATAFIALNDVFGRVFEVSPAEAAEPAAAAERAQALKANSFSTISFISCMTTTTSRTSSFSPNMPPSIGIRAC
ncbi:MAG TPA: hypothetical protein VGM07_03195 [Stellaceae bacterium]